jgi:hypothetical protein
LASQDAEANNLKREFDVLTAARQGGIFGAVDEQHEKDLLERYRRLIQRSAELRRTISESGCTVEIANKSTTDGATILNQTSLTSKPDPRQQSENQPEISRSGSQSAQMSAGAKPQAKPSPQERALNEEYDSLKAQLAAIEASLSQRASDLGGLPIKPEIAESIETSRSDLVAARDGISSGHLNVAIERLKRVKEALRYLRSL